MSKPALSTTDRVMSDVPMPTGVILDIDDVYKDGLPQPDVLIKHFISEGRLSKECCKKIVTTGFKLLRSEPNVLSVPAPIFVCGDIHGQFYDLLKLFELGGPPAETNYLFLGDYVDRGCFSAECVLLLLSYKLYYPKSFFMMRGNHECRQMTDYFNFRAEVVKKYDLEVYELIMTCFDALPLAAIVDKRFFCVHGGLSPQLETIAQIQKINRFIEPSDSGSMTDLLWADPTDDQSIRGFVHNKIRGTSYLFGHDAVCKFLDANKMLCLLRGHEAQNEGYCIFKANKRTNFPSVITIFSAPNYIDMYGNKAAILLVKKDTLNFKQFLHSPHPYWLPNFNNIFEWSIPFVAENAIEFLGAVMKLDEGADSEDEAEEAKRAARERIRTKVRAITHMRTMFKTLREEHENILKLKGLASGKIPRGLLSGGAEAIRDAVANFDSARNADLVNERHPSFALPK